MKTKNLLILLTLGLLSANLSAADLADAKKAEANWKKHCYSCHGNDGKGKTRAGRKAKVKDLTDAKVQALYSDSELLTQLKDGMKSKDGKELMKPFADKLSEGEMKDLVAFVRRFGK